MRPVFEAQVPKREDAPDEIEDAFAIRPPRGLYALSDGASESYHSAAWARVLVHRFVAHPTLCADWLAAAIGEYNAGFDRDKMSWSAQAAFDRGSFATLLGVSVSKSEGYARLMAVGDTLAVLVSGREVVATFPYHRPEQFQDRPLLLSTVGERNAPVLRPANMRAMTAEWRLKGLDAPRLLLMTDAVGAWVLGDPAARGGELLSLPSPSAFSALVRAERAAGRMRRDDCTLVVLG